jgi:exopolysaccharide biosynthesis polyprenyl glycosylphosphotransferase
VGAPAPQLTPPSDAPVAVPKDIGSERFSPHELRRRLLCADALAILTGLIAAFVVQELLRPVTYDIRRAHLVLAAIGAPFWYAGLSMSKSLTARAVERPAEEVRRLMAASAVGLGGMVVIGFAIKYTMLSRLWVASVFVFVTLALVIERGVARQTFRRLRSEGRIRRRVAIIGTDAHAIGLMHSLQRNPQLGYQVVGFIGSDDLGERGGCRVIGPIEHTEQLLAEHRCVGAMISLAAVDAVEVNRLTRRLTDAGFHIALSSSLRDIDISRMRPQNLDGRTLIYVEPTIRDGWRAHGKRAFDVVTAAVVLVLSGPILALAAIAIRLDSPGPVLFRQERVGIDGRRFWILKLRTMTVDAEERKAELLHRNEMDGPLFKLRDDPRVTRVGRVLRKLSIDELPQCWNVLRGEMSIVGPRPALPSEVDEWDDEVRERLRVRPGITGLWQVSGRNETSFEDYKRLDLYYVDNWSLLHDVKIVLRTLPAVALQRGAR